MSALSSFSPQAQNSTVNVAVGVASANVALGVIIGQLGQSQVEIVNISTSNTFVQFGGSGVVATLANGFPMLPNSRRVVTAPAGATYAAVIGSAANGFCYFTVGEGV